MDTEQIFIFTAGNAQARANLSKSISSPIELSWIQRFFNESDVHLVTKKSNGRGFYAWGATPTERNLRTWSKMQPGDWVFCVFENHYRYVARIVSVFDNPAFARATWGESVKGETWQYVFFLTKPTRIDISYQELSPFLATSYQGFTRVSPNRADGIVERYGSVEEFMEKRVIKS